MRVVTVAGIVAFVVLSGCGGSTARQMLGMDRRAPDAFAVSTHAPLEVPQNLETMQSLPVPTPGLRRTQDTTPESVARGVVLSSASDRVAAPISAGEAALLAGANAVEVNSQIRSQVNAEAEQDVDSQHGPLDWMLFWKKTPRAGVAVDAAAEVERLKTNQQTGKPATEGATPVVEDSGRLPVAKEIQ